MKNGLQLGGEKNSDRHNQHMGRMKELVDSLPVKNPCIDLVRIIESVAREILASGQDINR
jgi:hypothetical protein